jgi:hypothetical protein
MRAETEANGFGWAAARRVLRWAAWATLAMAVGRADPIAERLAGFPERRDRALAVALQRPFPREPKDNPADRVSRTPEWRRWAIPRVQKALIDLYQGRDAAAASALIRETAETLRKSPARFQAGPSALYWEGLLFAQVHALFGTGGSRRPGALAPEAERAMADLFWEWCDVISRVDQADPRRVWEHVGTENHVAMRVATLWSGTRMLAADPRYRERQLADGVTPAEHHAAWTVFAKAWIREKAQRGLLVEIAAPGYSADTLQCVYHFRDFATDPELRRLAENFLHLWWADTALELLNGVRGGSKARADRGPSGDWNGHADVVSMMAAYYFGEGGEPRGTLAPHLALLLSDYRPPRLVAALALEPERRGTFVYVSRRPGMTPPDKPHLPRGRGGPDYGTTWLDREHGGILRYTYVTPDYIVGSSMVPNVDPNRWAKISDQSRWSGIVFRDPEARIFAQCRAPEAAGGGERRGAGEHWTLQDEGTLIWQKLRTTRDYGATEIYLPPQFAVTEEAGTIFAQLGTAFVAIRPVGGTWTRRDERWLRLADEFTPIVFETGSARTHGSFERFQAEVRRSACDLKDGALHYVRARDGRRFTFFAASDRTGEIDGRPVDFAPPFAYRAPYLRSGWPAERVELSLGGETLALEF